MHHEITGFEHLHLHSDYSLLDGYGQVEEYAKRAPEINQKFLCISDHGHQGAVPRQIKACEDRGLNPIFACELYYNPHQPSFRTDADRKQHVADLSDEDKKRLNKNYHLLAIAFNEKGYSNLVKLSSWAYIYGRGGRPSRPRVNRDMLLEHKEGIIFTSCCYASEIGVTFDQHGEDAAMDKVAEYMFMFGENFRLEMMMLDFVKQPPYDRFIQKAHAKYGIPIILTQDCHYCKAEDSQMQRLMLMVQTGRTIQEIQKLQAEGADLFELQDSQLWMKSEDELNEMWETRYSKVIDHDLFKQAKRETVKLCEFAKGVKLDRTNKLPQIPDANDILKDEAKKGILARNLPHEMRYLDRLAEELELICRKGFSSYFLIQKQMTDEARRIAPSLLGWGDGSEAVGPGRGCLSRNSRVVLADGRTKFIAEIQPGDGVVGHDGTIQVVEKIFQYPCNEPLLRIKSYYGDSEGVTMTRDHKVWAEKQVRPRGYTQWAESTRRARRSVLEPKGEFSWITAGELAAGDWVFVPIPQVHDVSDVVFDLGQFANGSTLVVAKDTVTQVRFNNLTGRIRSQKISSRYLPLDEEWACLLGIFASDGWIRADGRFDVGFVFHDDQLDSMRFVKRKMQEFGFLDFRTSRYGNKKCIQLVANSRCLRQHLELLFDRYKSTPETKHVPQCILEGGVNLMSAFLHGYFLGDGSIGNNKLTATTVSRELADQVRFLIHRLGLPSSLGRDNRNDPRGWARQDSYVIRTAKTSAIIGEDYEKRYVFHPAQGQGVITRIRSIEEVVGVQQVYDIQVSNTHSFLTSSFAVHNSAVGALTCYCLGITDVDPIKHDLLFSRFLSEARGGKSMKVRFSNIDPIGLPIGKKTGYQGYSVDDGETWHDGI